MPSLNKVFLMGNLTRDPEVRVTSGRVAVAEFGLATSRRYRTGSGEEKEDRCFLNVTAWGSTAEAVGKSLRRGAPVYVEGRLKYDEWEREGVRHTRLSVVAERIQFLAPPAHGDPSAPVPPEPDASGDSDNLTF